jgi:hypothetical protein
MFRHHCLQTVVAPLIALAALFAVACPRAQAQVKPFQISGGGLADYIPVTVGNPVYHFARGQATELGQYFGEGEVQLDRFTGPLSAEFSSAVPFVFTAANGDKLAFTYGDTSNGAKEPGQVQLIDQGDGTFTSVWVAEFNPVPALCTGRFKNIIGGSFIMVAQTEPFVLGDTEDPVAYTWEGKGWIEFAEGK